MPDDWLNIALRFALYLDIAAAFGVALFGIHALHAGERSSAIAQRYRTFIGISAVVGIALSLWSMAVLARTISGVENYGELSISIFHALLTGTGMGIAWSIRILALTICFLLAVSKPNPIASFTGLTVASGSALATLAWAGHGAMHEEMLGYFHLASDIAHLWAAGAWIGALLAFLLLATIKSDVNQNAVTLLSRTSSGFARTGTIIVATLAVSGIINYLLIVGPSLSSLFTTLYGRLLLGKLALFAGMLVLAAANRFRLSPQLEAALLAADRMHAVTILRRSLFMETGLALLILACVAWLGVLSPGAS